MLCFVVLFSKVIPTGLCRLEIPKYGDKFTWIKPPTTVHNLIFGKVWLEQVSL